MCSSFFETILEIFGSFWWFSLPLIGPTFGHQSIPASSPHSCNCTAVCRAYLQEPELFVQKCAALPPYSPHLQLYLVLFCLFFHSMFLPTVLGCFHCHLIIAAVWHVHIGPISSGFPKQLLVYIVPYTCVKLFQHIKDRKYLTNCKKNLIQP